MADQFTKLKFLIDTGADISVLPVNMTRQHIINKGLVLHAANGTNLLTFGTQRLTLDLNLQRTFTWSFIVAKVNQPIDFLKKFNLLIDVKNNSIIASETMLSLQGKVANILPGSSAISIFLGSTKFDRI